MDIPALQFEECVLETSSIKPAQGDFERHTRERVTPSHSHSDNCAFESIDHVPPNIHNSSHSTQLYLFEDDAAVIQMINKKQSPNSKHVTKTHRVDLTWLFERANCDRSCLLKYVQKTAQKSNIFDYWNERSSHCFKGAKKKGCNTHFPQDAENGAYFGRFMHICLGSKKTLEL